MDRTIIASSTIILTCLFLSFLFTFAYARYPFDSTQVDIDPTNHDSFSVSENNVPADINTNILLPTQNHEFKPSTLIQWVHETTTNSRSSEPKAESVESIEVSKETDPFTFFNFRSIDPRIPRRPLPLYFRHRHHCRHNHRYKPLKPRFPRREDAMVNNAVVVEEDKNFDQVARGGVRSENPSEWTRFHEIEPMFLSRERSMAMEMSELLRRLYNHRHHHHHHHRHRHDHRDEPENKENGLMKRIRKFLKTF